MPFTPVRISEWGEDETNAYPGLVPDGEAPWLELGPEDGQPTILQATDLLIEHNDGKRDKKVLELTDKDITVVITDSRVAYACAKYDEGGGWVGLGGAAFWVAVVANRVSKAKAKKRTAGTCLAGQVRYPWLGLVTADVKTGPLSFNAVSVGLTTEGGIEMIKFTLNKKADSRAIATEIAVRAARYRQRLGVPSEEREAWDAVSRGTAFADSKRGVVFNLPSSELIND